MGKPLELTLDEAQRLAREVVDQFGTEHTYERTIGADGGKSCVYVQAGAPSCLVGHILHRAGVQLADMEDNNERSVDDDLFLLDVGVNADSPTEDFLAELQNAQDAGHPWGSALRQALAALDENDPDD